MVDLMSPDPSLQAALLAKEFSVRKRLKKKKESSAR